MTPLNSTYYVFYMAMAIAILFVLSFFILNRPIDHDNAKKIIYTRLLGALILGAIPFLLIRFINPEVSYYFVSKPNPGRILITLIVFVPIILFINLGLSKKISHQKLYPIIRSSNWSLSLYTFNLISWLLYIFAYESLFRGLLLFSSIQIYGVVIGVAINTLLYVIAHIPEGKFETLGAIPLGIIFCIVTIFTGSFVVAFILHCTMAVSNDVFCFINNPEMKLSNHEHLHA